ncbi:DPP IV N-terminal domain-containing protein [Halalkalibaculum sp. DA384]|uniref:S9 family peptidase n=1 Tax=Halalkalibaculum sp. DA384 TaxID=3373606 RepID=UPI003754C5B5
MRLSLKMIRAPIVLMLAILLSDIAYSQSSEKVNISSQDVVPAETAERLRAIYEENEFTAESFRGDWIPGGSEYLVIETLPATNGQALVSYDAASGTRTELVSASQLSLPESTDPLFIENYTFSPDGSNILISASSRKSGNETAHHWIFDFESGQLQSVTAGNNSRISPDGQHILFTEQGNLHVYNIQDEGTTSLTNDAVPGSISYNQAVWSPDSKRVVFVKSDASRVRVRKMLEPVDPSYPEVTETRFARVGGTIATLQPGVIDIKNKETRWFPIPIPSEGFYPGEISWAGNSNEVLVEKLSRFRDKRDFFIANVDSGTITTIFEESDPAWVVASYRTNQGLKWFDDYKKFLVLSEKDGWRHAYVGSRNGQNLKNITPGDYDIIDRVAVDESGGWFYFNASPENATQSYLFRARLDGTGNPERITPKNLQGTHNYDISPGANWAFHTYSSANNPPVTQIVRLPEHKVVRVLEDNKALSEKTVSWQRKEFFQVDIGDGIIMDGWMIKPGDFDPARKYPVFVYVYGEPHLQTVRDSWGSAMAAYHRAIADLGYLVISMDNRGTPAPKGAAWRRAVAGSLGPLSTEEQAAGLKQLGQMRPYVDLSRVGIWGWSGGGSNTLNALFRKPDIYDMGIAVVPKPQPHLYNAWFQEIYMKTPEVNPEGYEKSAPINYAEGLEGNLLILHGSGETNTHLEIVEGLVDRFITLGKQFDYFVYPNRNHGLSKGKGTPLHVRLQMARYLLTHLPPGPR